MAVAVFAYFVDAVIGDDPSDPYCNLLRQCLQAELSMNHPHDPNLISRLLAHQTTLCSLAVDHTRLLAQFKKCYPNVQLPALYKELFTVDG